MTTGTEPPTTGCNASSASLRSGRGSEGSASHAARALAYHWASYIACRTSATAPIGDTGKARSPVPAGVSWRCIATTGRRIARVPSASPVVTAALVPFTTSRDGATSRATTPWPRSFLFASASGRYWRSVRTCAATRLFQ